MREYVDDLGIGNDTFDKIPKALPMKETIMSYTSLKYDIMKK